MKYDFDRVIDRVNTNSVKWDFIVEKGKLRHWHATAAEKGDERVLPLWVADMDFASPQPVIDVLQERIRHGIFGYTARTASYDDALVDWMMRRHGWEIDPEWIITTPGVVAGVNIIVQAFVPPGEKVIVQTPVYYPFYSAVENNGGEIVRNKLVLRDGRYEMDFEDLERKATDPKTKLMILCSPHNPVGRVWTQQELKQLGEICIRNNVLVVADEIHHDLILSGNKFVPFVMAGEGFAEHSIICTAPSKTFNMAGFHMSNTLIPDPDIRERYTRQVESCGIGGVSVLGVCAVEAAYRHGEEWLEQMLAYIQANLDFLNGYIATHLPKIDVIQPEGTYLVWLDCRKLGLDKDDLEDLMLHKARVYLDEGYIFGTEGEGFERINIACPRSLLAESLDRIRSASQSI
jgi:cystathionine beta-lyase